jgi:serine/threonine protein kinase
MTDWLVPMANGIGSYKGRAVAVKLIFMIELAPKDVASFIEEASHLHSLRNHPNVVKLFGVCIRPPGLALVMELCNYGSLYDVRSHFPQHTVI